MLQNLKYFPVNIFMKQFKAFHTSANLARNPGIIRPHAVSWMWKYKKEMNFDEYTVDALKYIRTGGRGPDGRIIFKYVGRGLQRPFYMVDYNRSRQMQSQQIHEELVLKIFKSFYRHPFLALVASGNTKRWIIATSSMKPGSIIRSHYEIPKIPVDPKPGDAYPVGALPIGTQICLFEIVPGEGALICRSAGTSATIVRRGAKVGIDQSPMRSIFGNLSKVGRDVKISNDDICVVHEAGRKQEYRLLPECMVVVGQVSNVEHGDQRYANIQEKLNRGIRQRSGHYQKKTGRFGRKNRASPPLIDYTTSQEPMDNLLFKYSLPGQSEVSQIKETEKFALVNHMVYDSLRAQPSKFNAESAHGQPRFKWASWQKIR